MNDEKPVKHYWRAYHYNRDPFDIALHKQLYISNPWNEYLDLLPQFLRYCNSLVLIEGNLGVGKTTLIEQFIQENNGDANIVFINAEQCQGTEYLLELLQQKFSAPYDPKSAVNINEQLDQQIDFLKLNKAPRLLIIDDAEKLPLDMRQACLQITQQQTKLDTCLPIILLGSEQLNSQYHALLTSKTAENCLHFLYLAAFTKDDVDDYLQFACEQAGEQKGQSPFSEEDVETIYNATNGVIALIANSARNLLKVKLKQQSITTNIKKRAIWWGITLLVIIALLFVYKYLSQPTQLSTTFTTPIALRNNPPPPMRKPQQTQQIGNLLVNTKADKASKPSDTLKKNHYVSKPVNMMINAKQTSASKHHIQPKKTDLFNTVMQQRLANQKKRVFAISGKKFTLQLMAAENLHSIQHFISQHQLQSTAMIVPVKRNQKMWYLVLYGMFNSKQQATDTIKQVSPQLQKLRPWIRSYASIHQELKK